MASGLSPSLRKIMQDLLFGNTATAPTTAYFALHTGDPLGDGSAANEVPATNGYARVAFAFGSGTNWNACTTATGDAQSIVTNKNAISFPTATGAWASSATIGWYSIRLTSTVGDTTLGNFMGRGPITPGQVVSGAGAGPVIGVGLVSFTLAPS